MPDYDPKSIPILDDIIEAEVEDEDSTVIHEKEINADTAETEKTHDDNIPDLFSDDINDSIEPIEIKNGETESNETETVEAVLIDYQIEEDNEDNNDGGGIQHDVISEQPISLDSIVNDVVTQLMPDLEQQLRLLVQQALEEKLPEEIIRQMSSTITRNK
jgi:hypothetical protein